MSFSESTIPPQRGPSIAPSADAEALDELSLEHPYDANARPIVVTGACGKLGRRLVRALHRRGPVIGLDRRPFEGRPPDVEHCELDPRRRRVEDIFRNREVGAVVHLGVMHDPRGNSHEQHTWNLGGMARLLRYVSHYRVPKIIFLSSANVYGPRPDNAQFLTEDAPLLGAGTFSSMRDLVELDMLVQSFFWKHPSIETVVLRPAHILGSVKNAPSNYLRLGVVPTLMGFDPMVQTVHQDDVVRAIVRALLPGVRGIFNMAGPPPIRLSRALRRLGRTHIPIPHTLAKFGVDRLWHFRMTSFPAPELDFVRYVCMVDDSRARNVMGYKPVYNIDATLAAVDEERWV